MTTTRKTIRQKVATALTGNTAAGANVFASRTRPVRGDQLPAILVYSREESVEVFRESPRELRRELSLGIEIAATADDDLDDALDDLAQQVERIMSEQQTFRDPVTGDDTISDATLERVEIQLVGEGQNQHGSCVLTYNVVYYTDDVSLGVEGAGVPAANVLVPFETAHVQYKVAGSTATSPATADTISLPQ